MNYQNFASYDNKPPYHGQDYEALYDRGQGVPKIENTNMTIQDIYRTPFLFIQEHRKNYKNLSSEALKGIQSNSELSKLFFSDRNIKRVQKAIRKEVFKRTGGQFRLDVDQEVRDVFIAMRAVYMTEARFLPGHIVRQCKRLNRRVVDNVVSGIVTNIKQYYGYLQEISKNPDPIPLPTNTSNAGRRSLPSITTTFI